MADADDSTTIAIKGEFLAVAIRVLDRSGAPMSARAIVDFALAEKLFSDKLAGRTPHQSMNARLSVHIRRFGARSPFVRTGPGRFFLRRLLGSRPVYEARPFRPPPAKERVLVVPSDWFAERTFQGVNHSWQRFHRLLFKSRVCSYIDRAAAEETEEFKQLLTYVIVTRGRDVLSFRRGNYSRAADFLRGRSCIGFGGHVTDHDLTLLNQRDMGLVDSSARELAEELDLPKEDLRRLNDHEGISLIGVLNDDSSAVGRRHLAFLLRYEVSKNSQWDHPKPGEKSVTGLRWIRNSAKLPSLFEFEYWSQLCIREYFPGIAAAAPSFLLVRRRRLEPPRVVAVLGEVGSGKTEATRVLVTEFGYLEVNSGQVLARLLDLPPVPETPRDAFQAAAWQFINRAEGPTELAAAIVETILSNRGARVLIDGIRQRATLNEVSDLLGRTAFGVLYVHTTPDLAYNFYERRSGRTVPIADFLRVRDAPVEREIADLIGEADAVVYNWVGKAMYRDAVRRLMSAVLRGRPRNVRIR